MWLWLVGAAHAGLLADLRAASADGPEVALACTSAREAADRLERLFVGMNRPFPGLPPWWQGLLGAELGQEVMDLDGPVWASGWRAEPGGTLSFATEATAESVARRIATAREGVAVPGIAGWVVTTPGLPEVNVTADRGMVTIRGPLPEGATPRRLPDALLAALPEAPGCLVALHMAVPEAGDVDLAAHLPFTPRTEITFAVASEKLTALEGVVLAPQPPPPVRTERAPDGVVVVGLGLDGVNFSRFLAGDELRLARRMQRRFPLTAGTTVGIVHHEPDPILGAALPFDGVPADTLARRTRKLLHKLDAPVVQTDGRHFTVIFPDLTLVAAAQDGRLLLANDAGLLAEMEADRGEAWVAGKAAELAAAYPVVTVTSALPDGNGTRRLAEPASFAVTLEPGVLRGKLYLPMSIEEFAAFVERAAAARREKLADELRSLMPDETEQSPGYEEDPSP